jgi:nitrogen fixation protein NifB
MISTDAIAEASPCGTSAPGGIDFNNHPCFSKEAHKKYGRIHLPVAPRCNIQCNFCNRKYDCINESRPGVTSNVLTPGQAVAYLESVVAKRPEIAVVGIAGPGDPFANPDETMETLRLVRKKFPKLMLCVATNGMGIAPYIDELAELNTSHVTITMTAVDPEIGAKIYSWVRDGKRPLRGVEGAAALQQRQIEALVRLKQRGVVVKINSIVIPGINDEHMPEIAAKVAGLGADLMNCMALVPVKGAEFENMAPPDNLTMARVRLQGERHLKQMTHCARCRADAVGFIGEEMTAEQHDAVKHFAGMSRNPLEDQVRPYVAVATMEGALVNQHLGEADRFAIYEQDLAVSGRFKLIETRPAPPEGGGENRWAQLGETLKDCRAILVTAAGPTPQKALAAAGLKVIEMEGIIDEGLKSVFANQSLPASLKRRFNGCGAGVTCKGTGNGCG